MQGILITNGGPHSGAAWAEATATHILAIADDIAPEKRGVGIKLMGAIVDILEKHHDEVQAGERLFIANDSSRLVADGSPSDHTDLDAAVAAIIAAGQATQWAPDFSDPAMPDRIRATLISHFQTSMQIERSWHADRNPDLGHSIEFKATLAPAVTPAGDSAAITTGE
jgi:hypothetical protein